MALDPPSAIQSLPPVQRAQVILAAAQADMLGQLWKAALGTVAEDPLADSPALDGVTLAGPDVDPSTWLAARVEQPSRPPGGSNVPDLGANDIYAGAITAAARRAGLPATALASIIDAEAGKRADGRWDAAARNPRSSAAGLAQFLGSTWLGEAQRDGTWLNMVARSRGWIDAGGRVLAHARSDLLDLRFDPRAAIEAAADYARSNLDSLRAAGVELPNADGALARLAYLGHHLGAGDAVKFLSGGLSEARARLLLTAQVGREAAATRIAQFGDAAAAHRDWLTGYVGRRVVPERFAALF